VVPNAFGDTPGSSSFLGPLANSARTYQLLIAGSQLTEHLGRTITSIGFRLPAGAPGDWPTADATFANYDIRLSGSVDPSARSLTFADNIVGDQTLVRSGELVISAGSFVAGATPNEFSLPFSFDSGYFYGGGNLLIEIRHTGFSGTSRSVDAIPATGGAAAGYGTVFSAAWTGSYTGVSGSQGNFSVRAGELDPRARDVAAVRRRCRRLAGPPADARDGRLSDRRGRGPRASPPFKPGGRARGAP
jgi:hypothetical protein